MPQNSSPSNAKTNFHFFLQALNSLPKTGALMPSSRFLAGKMMQYVDFEQARFLVELGAGNGTITRRLLERMRPDARLVVFEINAEFCKELNAIPDPRLEVRQESACALQDYLGRDPEAQSPDVILSGLPLAILPTALKDDVLRYSAQALKPSGYFIQFQYSTRSRRLLKRHFSQVRMANCPLNFPPAVIYTCTR